MKIFKIILAIYKKKLLKSINKKIFTLLIMRADFVIEFSTWAVPTVKNFITY